MERSIDFRRNPHLKQIQAERVRCNVYTLTELSRRLTDDAPRLRYQQIPHSHRSVNHWGQRKLLLSEIEFLTQYSEAGDFVVYAGAAPGTHITYLTALFPQLDFLCVDPADFKVQSAPPRLIVRSLFSLHIFLSIQTTLILPEKKPPLFFDLF